MNVRDKVLIVEDDEGIRKFLSTTLIANGYSVILADDGKSALELVSSHCPVCILLDLGLPDIDGNEIIRSIRSWTSIPILVISARTTEDDKAGRPGSGRRRLPHQALQHRGTAGPYPHRTPPRQDPRRERRALPHRQLPCGGADRGHA